MLVIKQARYLAEAEKCDGVNAQDGELWSVSVAEHFGATAVMVTSQKESVNLQSQHQHLLMPDRQNHDEPQKGCIFLILSFFQMETCFEHIYTWKDHCCSDKIRTARLLAPIGLICRHKMPISH